MITAKKSLEIQTWLNLLSCDWDLMDKEDKPYQKEFVKWFKKRYPDLAKDKTFTMDYAWAYFKEVFVLKKIIDKR